MTKLNEFNNQLISEMIVEYIAEHNNISLENAKKYISQLSFLEYLKLTEAVVPPSGQTIGSNANTGQTKQPGTSQTSSQQIKSIWPGKGAPVQVGMTVGLKDPKGVPVPGQVSQVDMPAKGVKVKNPTTGKEEWMNTDNLEPFMAQQKAGSTITTEQDDLQRLKELAGISENCSAGATGAGAIAIAPAPMGKMHKRQPTEETLKKEYTPKHSAKTIIGDTKPNQASGELSATLAANGKKTASRANNGFKK